MPKPKKPSKKIVSPKKHKESYWDFYEVMHYLEKLHKKDFQDYAGKWGRKDDENDLIPYQNFWHWILDLNDVHNGVFIHLPEWSYYMNNKDTEAWKKEIMQHFYDFLGSEYHERLWCAW